MDRVIGPFPSNPSGPLLGFGPPSVLLSRGFLEITFTLISVGIKFSYTTTFNTRCMPSMHNRRASTLARISGSSSSIYGGLSPLVGCTIAERYTLFCQPLGLVHVHLELPHRGIAKVRGIAIARGLQWLGHNNTRRVGHDLNNKK